jgi:hypothetical protein
MGMRSCAYWLQNTVSENAGEHWIDGYLTGANTWNGSYPHVGDGVDSVGIYAEVKKLCYEHPSKKLVVATGNVWIMLRGQKR